MKRFWLACSVVLLVVVLGATGFAAGRGGSGDAVPEATFDMLFDGYCSGMHVSLSASTGVAVGDLMSWCSSCPDSANWAGNVVFNLYPGSHGIGWYAAYEVGPEGAPPYFYTAVSLHPRTWTHFWFDGTVMNSGTWSFCTEMAPPGAPSSFTDALPGTGVAAHR